MKWSKYMAGASVLAMFLSIVACPLELPAAAPEAGDVLTVSGIIDDAQGKGVKEVEIEVLVNGQPAGLVGKEESVASSSSGAFVGRYRLPFGTLPDARLQIRAVKPSWQAADSEPVAILAAGQDTAGNRLFQTHHTLKLKRQITPAFWIASGGAGAGLHSYRRRINAPHPGGAAGGGGCPVHQLHRRDLQ